MGYKFQFVTLAGFHALNHGMFELARAYRDEGMAAYSRLQQAEFASEAHGYTATRHQREVGTGYFDDVANVIAGGLTATAALGGSTERRSSNVAVACSRSWQPPRADSSLGYFGSFRARRAKGPAW